jgi:hypothetical protein
VLVTSMKIVGAPLARVVSSKSVDTRGRSRTAVAICVRADTPPVAAPITARANVRSEEGTRRVLLDVRTGIRNTALLGHAAQGLLAPLGDHVARVG